MSLPLPAALLGSSLTGARAKPLYLAMTEQSGRCVQRTQALPGGRGGLSVLLPVTAPQRLCAGVCVCVGGY